MKDREFQTLARKYLLPRLPGFGCKGPLLCVEPIEYLLRGFCFEPSGFSRDQFFVWAFIQPLYVPSDHLFLNFGDRLRGGQGERWTLNHEDPGVTMERVLAAIKEQGLPLIESIRTPADMAVKAPHLGSADHPITLETVAYSYILARNFRQASGALDQWAALCQRYISEAPNLAATEAESLQRNQTVRDRLTQDPEAAVDLLRQWSEQTRVALRLPVVRPT